MTNWLASNTWRGGPASSGGIEARWHAVAQHSANKGRGDAAAFGLATQHLAVRGEVFNTCVY
jgi:hypothetical protein